jgi:DSF synthase
MVQEMMLNGRVYSSEELFDMGVIDILAESGEGQRSVYSYVEKSTKYRNGYRAMQQVKQRVNPITYDELWDVCSFWVDIAMEISERDIRLMDRLINAQNRKAATGYQETAMRNTG